MSKRRDKKDSNEVTNFYTKIPSKMKPKYHNPSFENHKMNIPFRALIVGGSGSGKTNVLVDLLRRFDDTFGNMIICTRNADEPLYNWLKTKVPAEQLQIYEGLQNLPPLDSLDPSMQHLIVFDDLVLEKNQKAIEEMFIRARKIAKGVSVIYISQSYFRTPKIIRLNCNYIILKKLSSLRDLNIILRDYALGISKDTLLELYRYCTRERTDFMMIDIDSPPEERFRKNFLEVLDVEQEI